MKSTGEMKDKRTVYLADDGNVSINVTVWGEQSRKYDFIAGDIIAFTSVRVSDYGGRSINTNAGSSVIVDPKAPDTRRI